MAKRIYTLLTLTLLAVATTLGQIVTPVRWSTSFKADDDGRAGTATLTATIDNGWHLYGLDIPSGGPTATTVDWSAVKGATPTGKLQASSKPHEQYDANFDMTLSWWTGTVTLTQRFKLDSDRYDIKGSIRYMACNDKMCSPPATEPLAFSGTVKAAGNEENAEPSTDEEPNAEEVADSAAVDAPVTATIDANRLWEPVNVDNGIGADSGSSRGLWGIFLTCFLGGLLALLTPCVWPIIPMTVSFFLKKSDSRAQSIRNAIVYGLSIIIIYVSLGLIVTALFGPSTLNAIATNAVCNIIFFLLLVVFAISFFGAFDLHLPGSWSTRLDKASRGTSGLLSLFFMAFTLAIVSFSCTGPIIGTLLVEAAGQGNRVGPAIGMFGFSLALAIPFTLFALFPSWLKKMPKGGRMA